MSPARRASLVAVLAGSALRLYNLTLNPLHHDEGVNGFFMLNLVRRGVYRYDPANYHGPSLYYADLPFLKIFGLHTEMLRIEPVLFGIGVLLLLALGLPRLVGERAAFIATALAALSPGMVYISRYFIHEMMVVFFTLGLVLAVAHYLRTPGQTSFFLGTASAGFLFATKETAAPTVLMLLIAAGCTRLVVQFWPLTAAGKRPGRDRRAKREERKDRPEKPAPRAATSPKPEGITPAERALLPHRDLAVILWGLVVFIGINVMLYSSFWTNKHGVYDALRALSFWTSTGDTAQKHALTKYFAWLWQEEGPILALGLAGAALAIFQRKNCFAMFCAWWSIGVLMMYSLVPYKTPWICVNMVLPLAIMAGVAMDEISERIGAKVGSVIIAGLLVWVVAQSISLNFVHYDDERYAYVYAHTVRDVKNLLAAVRKLTKASGQTDPHIAVWVSDDAYWPLPWYLRNNPNAAFYGPQLVSPPDSPVKVYKNLVPLTNQAMAIVRAGNMYNGMIQVPGQANVSVRADLARKMVYIKTYELRGGVDLMLFATPSLAAKAGFHQGS